MRERVVDAHRALGGLFERARDGLRSGDAARARAALGELRDALETHFEQEDALYYPTLRALRPELGPKLEDISRAHREFRSDLDALEAAIAAPSFEATSSRFDAFAAAFAQHEAAEEALLASLDEATELASEPAR